MACILKTPTLHSKGVVSFTDIEVEYLEKNLNLKSVISSLNDKWVFGIHYNKYKVNQAREFFDFHVTKSQDIAAVLNQNQCYHIDMIASNFIPNTYKLIENCPKHWDILAVSRPIKYKRLNVMFHAIKSLFKQGKKYRSLLISPQLPPVSTLITFKLFNPFHLKKVLFQIKDRVSNLERNYEQLFTSEEKQLFNFFNLSANKPLPLDQPTLAHFFHSSKVFVHTANNENTPRVIAIALSCGLPVVGYSCIQQILPTEFHKEPYFFIAKNDKDLPNQIDKAIQYVHKEYNIQLFRSIRHNVQEEFTAHKLLHKIEHLYNPEGVSIDPNTFYLKNIEQRIARHIGFPEKANNFFQAFDFTNIWDLLKQINNYKHIPADTSDFEKDIEKSFFNGRYS